MLPAISWAILVLCLYAIPGREIRSITFWDLFAADKLAHILVFMLFVTILRVGLRRQARFPFAVHRASWIAVGFAIVYGGVLEFMQGILFSERTADIMDFFANTMGALLGLLLFRMIYGKDLSRA